MDRSAFRVARPYKCGPEIQAWEKYWKKKNGLSRPAINTVSRATYDIVQILGCSIRVYTTAATVYLRVASNVFRPTPFSDQTAPLIAAACVSMASKIQNVHMSYEEVLEAAHRLLSPDTALLAEEAEVLKQRIIEQEFEICANLAYDLRFSSPHRILIQLCKEFRFPKDGARIAWSILSDMHRTFCPILQPAHSLAIAALNLASEINRYAHFLPHDSELYYNPSNFGLLFEELNFFYKEFSSDSFLKTEAPDAIIDIPTYLRNVTPRESSPPPQAERERKQPIARNEDPVICTVRYIPDLKPEMKAELSELRSALIAPALRPTKLNPALMEGRRQTTSSGSALVAPSSLPKRPALDDGKLSAHRIETHLSLKKRPRHDFAS